MKSRDPQAEFPRLRAYYAQLSETDLTELGSQYESLTDAAKAAIRAEFDRRGMPAPELVEPEIVEFQPLVTIRQYRDPADAMLAKAALESATIFAFLRDENTVRMDWVWSNLIGGFRLQVRPEDAEAAEHVLSQPIPSTIQTDGFSYEQPCCPFCQSLDVAFEGINSKVGFATTILAVPIPWRKNRWTCRACGHTWKDDSSEA